MVPSPPSAQKNSRVRRLVSKTRKRAGAAPGTLIHVGERKSEQSRIRIIDYDEGNLEERELKDPQACRPHKDKTGVSWINVDGIHEIGVIETVGRCFNLHPLILEDILNTEHRPKVEMVEDYLFIVLKMLHLDEATGCVVTEQVSLVLGQGYVLSFQEREGDVFDPVRERLRSGKGRIRKQGADYLAYALLDAVVDSYFAILEKLGEKLEFLEEELIQNPHPETLEEIHGYKREMILLRKSIWPLREVISSLYRGESPLIEEGTTVFLRDVYDHTIQVIDTVETFRDLVSGLLDLYLSSISNRMNEVMKVLTIMATMFIPLTFIAGIYGMNFEVMPELHWKYGYAAVWGLMAFIGGGMVFYFRRKKWL